MAFEGHCSVHDKSVAYNKMICFALTHRRGIYPNDVNFVALLQYFIVYMFIKYLKIDFFFLLYKIWSHYLFARYTVLYIIMFVNGNISKENDR